MLFLPIHFTISVGCRVLRLRRRLRRRQKPRLRWLKRKPNRVRPSNRVRSRERPRKAKWRSQRQSPRSPEWKHLLLNRKNRPRAVQLPKQGAPRRARSQWAVQRDQKKFQLRPRRIFHLS